MRKLAICFLLWAVVVSCKNSSNESYPYEGLYSKNYVVTLSGFGEELTKVLATSGVTLRDFQAWSTDSSWSLPADARAKLRTVRTTAAFPSAKTLLQKVIPLEDVGTYMNNTYGGTVGGFVSVAADMKSVSTLADTYWGLRLDYPGTKFKPDGAGYAVIRFYSDIADKLTIPFCVEMGGSYPHSWPNGGGGFTTSTLGGGGYPEYTFSAYNAPQGGAELYEVTPEGREILRSTYITGKGWTTNEFGVLPTKSGGEIRNGLFNGKLVTTYADYGGNRYIVRGRVGDEYHLVTHTRYEGVELSVVEKNCWAINVPIDEVKNLREE